MYDRLGRVRHIPHTPSRHDRYLRRGDVAKSRHERRKVQQSPQRSPLQALRLSLTRNDRNPVRPSFRTVRKKSARKLQWSAAGITAREAALLLFRSVHVTVSAICRISFACAQSRIETE